MQHTKLLMVMVAVVLFLISGALVAFSLVAPSKTSQPLPSQQTFLPDNVKNIPVPEMRLELLNSKQYYVAGETIPVTVTASSRNAPVLGFDIIVNYDPAKVSYTGKVDQNTQFEIFDRSSSGRVVLTGTKRLNVNTPLVLRDGGIVLLNFQAKTDGAVPLNLAFKAGDKRLSNIMNEDSQNILQKVQPMTVYVGNRLALSLNQPVAVPNANITLTLTKRVAASPRCNDCIEQAIVEAKQGNKTVELDYKIGGLAGFLITQQDAFGYAFAVDSLQPQGMNLIYTRK